MAATAIIEIPKVVLPNSSVEVKVPVIGLGCGPDFIFNRDIKEAVIEAIKLGYRHFDTASAYGTEQALGEAFKEAFDQGLVSRQDLFVTSKIWAADNHPHRVLPALHKSLQRLQLEYLDLYLIHWPLSCQPGEFKSFPIDAKDLLPFDVKGVWESMEECLKLGLTRAIGVCNFSINKLQNLLSIATIPPAVNQVEMNVAWRQKKLREFCNANGIVVTAYSPLMQAARWGPNEVMETDLLKEIADAHGKSIAQVCLRWLYEQGVTFVPQSFNKQRMKQNLQIFDWALINEDNHKINQIKQNRLNDTATNPPLPDFWDEEI